MNRICVILCSIFLLLVAVNPVWAGGLEDAKAALSAEMKGRLDEAIELYTLAINSGDLSPRQLALVYNNRGFTYNRKGNFARALDDYYQAIELQPEEAFGYINRSVTYEKVGLVSLALADARRFVKLKKGRDIQGHKHLQRLENRLEESAETADRQASDDQAARGLVLKNQGRHKQAMGAYSRALELDMDNVQAINRLAWLLATCPDNLYRFGPVALELAKRAVALDPGPATRDTLAAAYAEAGRFEEAVQTQEKVIKEALGLGMPASSLEGYRKRLEGYRQRKPWRDQ